MLASVLILKCKEAQVEPGTVIQGRGDGGMDRLLVAVVRVGWMDGIPGVSGREESEVPPKCLG